MQSLFPTSPTELTDDDLADLYAYPTETTWIRANFIATLDGKVQGPDKRSGSLSSDADTHLFSLLRSLADVIVVGAGTARAEGYQPVGADETWVALRQTLGLAPVPTMAVVTRSLDLDKTLLGGGEAPTIVVTCESSPAQLRTEIAQTTPMIIAGTDDVDHAALREELTARGLQRILTEGGPTLIHGMVRQGVVDELCLTLTPQLIAGDSLSLGHGAILDPPAAWTLRHLLESDSDLFARYTRR